MNTSAVKMLSLAVLLVLLACAISCDEIEDDIVDVGLLQIHPVQPVQTVPTLGEESIQKAVWIITDASIQFPLIAHDLTLSDDCIFQQSYISLSTGSGDCMLGAAVEVSPTPAGVLSFTAEMSLSRVRQVDVSPGGDLDDDGVLNDDDNCPLVANPEQETVPSEFDDEFGIPIEIGEACAFDTSGGIGEPAYYLDNELDEVPDIADNCPYHPNPGQENTPDGFPSDGIGDACTDTATVSVSGQTSFSMDLDVDTYVQERLRMLVVLDFGNDLSGLNCDWMAGTCDLDPASIRACILNDRLTASAGCP